MTGLTKPSRMTPIRFSAPLLGGHKGLAAEVPGDPASLWGVPPRPLWRGRRGHSVLGTINGVPFATAIVPRSQRFWVLVPDDVAEAARATSGDRCDFSLKPEVGEAPSPARPKRAPRKKTR